MKVVADDDLEKNDDKLLFYAKLEIFHTIINKTSGWSCQGLIEKSE